MRGLSPQHNKYEVMELEKPILFNTEMVQAILEGRKTCTRRVIKKKYENADIDWFENKYGKRLVYIQNDVPEPVRNPNGTTTHSLVAMKEIKKPYQKGDILYVRETWMMQSMSNFDKKAKFLFKAKPNEKLKEVILSNDRYKDLIKYAYKNGWQPSLFMPKEAARIFLKVANVRVERLQDITEDQIKKEGIREEFPPLAQDAFQELWDSTTKEYRWRLNPWVWVIEFEIIHNMKEGMRK